MKRRNVITSSALATVGLAGCLGPEHEFRITAAAVESDPSPFDMEIEVIDPDATFEGPARLELSVTNTGDQPVQVRNQGIWPFGVLQMAKENPFEVEATRAAHFGSDAYEESEHVEKGPNSDSLDRTFLKEQLTSGQSAAERYTLSGKNIDETGEYSIYGVFPPPLLFEFSRIDDDSWEEFLPETSITVESPGLL